MLRVKDLKEIPIFNNFKSKRELIGKNTIDVHEGVLTDKATKQDFVFSKLPSLVNREDVSRILELVGSCKLDEDPDSVDGMCTHEMYVISDKIDSKDTMKLDNDPKEKSKRTEIRKKIKQIIDPILDNYITPFVLKKYCSHLPPDKQYKPFYSLIRNYNEQKRLTHAPHRDGHAYCTVVVSLSDYEKEYTGGLYVATTEKYKHTVVLNRGDAIVHECDLLHGVKVKGTRWSWIVWYRDSLDKDNIKEHFKSKATDGNAIYESLYADTFNDSDKILWHTKSCDNGNSISMVKLARGYLKLLPSVMSFEPENAEKLYRHAIEVSEDPNAYYGLAQMLLWRINKNPKEIGQGILDDVIGLLEESAKGGNTYAMFNLGIAHLYGYTGNTNMEVANEWFYESSLAEGFYVSSMYHNYKKNSIMSENMKQKAESLGYGTKWRRNARNSTGIGGASGVDLNLNWPTQPDIFPEKF